MDEYESGAKAKWKHTISAVHKILSPVVASQSGLAHRRSSKFHGYKSITKYTFFASCQLLKSSGKKFDPNSPYSLDCFRALRTSSSFFKFLRPGSVLSSSEMKSL